MPPLVGAAGALPSAVRSVATHAPLLVTCARSDLLQAALSTAYSRFADGVVHGPSSLRLPHLRSLVPFSARGLADGGHTYCTLSAQGPSTGR
jgi:hypothetical protein